MLSWAPSPESVFYEDDKLWVCLGFHRIPGVQGRSLVIWKEDVPDLNELSLPDYLLLMRVVYAVRSALMEHYGAEKVYVAYLDESRHVHFHLFPRPENAQTGFGFMAQVEPPEDTPESDYEAVAALKKLVKEALAQ